MTQRYLLFDSGCSVCTRLAEDIERTSDGWLAARSLRDPDVKALLDAARPGWRWEPTLLEVTDGHPRVFTGVAMRARMALGLGPRRAWHIMQILTDAVMSVAPETPRRAFLRRSVIALAGTLLGSSLITSTAKAASQAIMTQELARDEVDEYVQLVRATSHFQAFVQRLGNTRFKPFSLDGERVNAIKLSSANETYVAVIFSVKGGAGHSFYSATIRESSRQIAEDRAVLFAENASGDIEAYLEQNGQFLGEVIISRDGKVLHKSGPIAGESIYKAQGMSNRLVAAQAQCDVICCLNGCLASQGIAAWVIALVGLFCAVACAGTFGTGCAVCLVVTAGVINGVANYCVSQCIVKQVPYNGCIRGC